MTKEEFVAQLDRAVSANGELPVTSSLLRHLSEQLKKGDPPWWAGVARAWEKRKFVAWTEAWGLLLTCVHYEALSDAQSPLVPFFPSCGGTDEADPAGPLAKFLADLPKSFFDNLKTAHRRTYIESRAPLWIPPAMFFFQTRKLSYYLVEVNAGAGLNLAADHAVPQKGFDSDLVAARIGLDPRPLELEDISHRRWLTASLMPDQMPLISTLDKAMEIVQGRCRKEATFIQLVPSPPESAARFLAKNIPADDSEVGLLVYNMGTTVRMADAEYEAFRKGMAELLAAWGDRGLWLEVESVRGELYSTTYQVRLHRLLEGQLKTHVMASFDFSARKVQMDMEASAAFLSYPAKK